MGERSLPLAWRVGRWHARELLWHYTSQAIAQETLSMYTRQGGILRTAFGSHWEDGGVWPESARRQRSESLRAFCTGPVRAFELGCGLRQPGEPGSHPVAVGRGRVSVCNATHVYRFWDRSFGTRGSLLAGTPVGATQQAMVRGREAVLEFRKRIPEHANGIFDSIEYEPCRRQAWL